MMNWVGYFYDHLTTQSPEDSKIFMWTTNVILHLYSLRCATKVQFKIGRQLGRSFPEWGYHMFGI